MYFRNVLTKYINGTAYILKDKLYSFSNPYLSYWLEDKIDLIEDKNFISVLKDNNLIRSSAPSCKITNENLLSKLHIQLTNACMCKCKHCYVGDQKFISLSLSEVANIIDEFIDVGVLSIDYSGGEPTLNKDFSKIIQYGKSQGLKQTLFTNGYIDSKNIFSAIELCIDTIQISLDGSEQYHNLFRNNAKVFRHAIESLRIFSSMKKKIIISMSLTLSNVNELPFVFELANKYNAEFRVSPPVPVGNFSANDSYYSKLLLQLKEVCNKENISLNELVPRNCNCNAIQKSIYIDARKNIYPCPLLSDSSFLIGQYEQHKVKQILNSDKTLCLNKKIKSTYLQEKCLFFCPAFIFSLYPNKELFWGKIS